MGEFLKGRISKIEQCILALYLPIIVFSYGVVFLKSGRGYIFEAIIGSLIIYFVSRYAIITFARLCYALWSKSPVWPYKSKFMWVVINFCMYAAALFILVFTVKAAISLDPQVILYVYGLSGLIGGGLKARSLINEGGDDD